MKTMKIVAVSDVRTDKNDREYKLVTLSNPSVMEVVDPESGEVFKARVQALKASMPAYKNSYLDDTPDFLWESEVGDIVLGEVVTRKVPSYTIEDENQESREVSLYTCAVLGSSEDEKTWETAIEKAFKNNGHTLTGEESPATEQATVSMTANAPEEDESVPEESEKEKSQLEF